MLYYFKCEQNLLTNIIWIFTISNLRVYQWEILAKEFTWDVYFGYKDTAHTQNELVFTDFD